MRCGTGRAVRLRSERKNCRACASSSPRYCATSATTEEAAELIERAKLNYMYGSTLLTLAERHKPSLLPHAVERLGDALSIARRHVPEHVVTIKSQLYRAEHSLAMMNTSTAPEEHAS